VTFTWDDEKNEITKKLRNVSFEEIVLCISEGRVVSALDNEERDLIESIERGEWKEVEELRLSRNPAITMRYTTCSAPDSQCHYIYRRDSLDFEGLTLWDGLN
jgi:hypothetical protein